MLCWNRYMQIPPLSVRDFASCVRTGHFVQTSPLSETSQKIGKLSECHVRLISPLGCVGRSAFSLSSQPPPRRSRTRIMYSDGLWNYEGWGWRGCITVRGCSTEGDFWAVVRTFRDFALWVQCSWQNLYSRLVLCLDLWRNKIGDVL